MRSLPTGTVTFLFTDVEGSTRLWEQHPEAMRSALARHDQLLRGCIEDREGYVFKTVGDAFCAAFPTANSALEAALAAQMALAAEPWEMPTSPLVRMALHTGATEERGGDYFGQTLSRVARLMAAGHGGQVLLSEATHGLVRDALPPDASLVDLNQHRLKDLGRPEQVFQLLHPSLPADFPPLASLDNPALPNNLPQQTTSFVGREKQVEEVKALLARTRLLTLTGAGGSGKTRLSLQVAADLLTSEGDGVWLVELAALSDPALVPQAVANVLGVKEQTGKSIQSTLVEALKAKRLLIVLDNCEHLVPACASLAADLLRACPDVHLLASSREPLNVAGEQTYHMPPLSLPDPKQAQTVESLSQSEAVRLFIERAKAVRPAFIVTDANAPAVAQICRRLDGIPLAIEMAAARVRSLSVKEINVRMDHQFHLLTGGSRTALPRQQTLRALIDWSYDLLTGNERTLLGRLSVFAGGWTLSAAEGVCSGKGVENSEVMDLLTGLVHKSLVVYEEGDDDVGRYRLLETVRHYAQDRLNESEEAKAVCGRSASWFLSLAEEAEPHLTGVDQALWLRRLETEHDNLRASLVWYKTSPEQMVDGTVEKEDAEAGLRLAAALSWFWVMRGHCTEGRQWLGQALESTKTAGGPEVQEGSVGWEALTRRAKALSKAGQLAVNQNDYPAARPLYEEGLTIRHRLGDQMGIANSLNHLADLAGREGDITAAKAFLDENLAIRRRLGDQAGTAHALNHLADLTAREGDYTAARILYEEGLMIYRRLGYQQEVADCLGEMGCVAAAQGDYVSGRALNEESVAIWRRLGNPNGIAYSLVRLGRVIADQGDYASAQRLLKESLAFYRLLGHQIAIASNLEGIAGVPNGESQSSWAARLAGAASSLRESIGSPRPPAEQAELDKTMAAVRRALGETAFAAAWDAGWAMTMEQAVEYALAGPDGEPSGTPSGPRPVAPS